MNFKKVFGANLIRYNNCSCVGNKVAAVKILKDYNMEGQQLESMIEIPQNVMPCYDLGFSLEDVSGTRHNIFGSLTINGIEYFALPDRYSKMYKGIPCMLRTDLHFRYVITNANHEFYLSAAPTKIPKPEDLFSNHVTNKGRCVSFHYGSLVGESINQSEE